jgi:hypothetical protein
MESLVEELGDDLKKMENQVIEIPSTLRYKEKTRQQLEPEITINDTTMTVAGNGSRNLAFVEENVS